MRPPDRFGRWYDGSAAADLVTRLSRLDFLNATLIFGAMFLVSVLPFVILVSSFTGRHFENDLVNHMGLDHHAAGITVRLFDADPHRSASAVILALVLTFSGCVGVADCMQRQYEGVFGVPHRHGGNWPRLFLWVTGLIAWFAVDAAVSAVTHHAPAGILLYAVCVVTLSGLFFWWSMHLLLRGAISWRRLLSSAVTTAVFWLGLAGFSALYFSSTISSDSRLYGAVGVVFSLLTWLIAIAAVMVLGAVVGDVWHERHAARHVADVRVPPPRVLPQPSGGHHAAVDLDARARDVGRGR